MSRQAVPFERSEPLPGVRVVTERMPHVRSASVGLWVDVGSRDEPDPIAGASHLLEHLLFKGTPTRSARDIADAIDAVGGELNAYSGHEHTCYYARVLDTDLTLGADVLLDMFSHALLRDDDLEAERKVVLEELHMAADVPEDRVHDLFAERAWPGHPLGRPIIGTAETVGSIDRGALARFYGEGYNPSRLVVAAAGNVDHDTVVAHVIRGLNRPGSGPFTRTPSPPVREGAVAAYETRTTEQVNIVWGGNGIPRRDPDRYALSVFNALFGGSMSSRLFQEVRENRGLTYSVYSGYNSYTECGLFDVYAGTQEGNAATVLEIVREQAADVAGGSLTPEEVERAKGHVKGGLVLSMDDPGGRMFRIGRAELLHKEILSVDELLRRVDEVTVDDVQRVAQRLFGGEFVLSCVGPVAEGTLDRFVDPL